MKTYSIRKNSIADKVIKIILKLTGLKGNVRFYID